MTTFVAPPMEPWWVKAVHVGILGLVACLAVIHGWRPGYVLAPTDALKLVAPWEDPNDRDYVARNEQLLDQTVQFVPWTIYAKRRLTAGQIPLWNPHSQLGAPFVGNGQSAVFYPTMLLHLYLPETWSWTLSAALRLFAAGLGVWMLAGHYGLGGVPRLLAGVAFMLCGFNVAWLNHPQMNVMPLLPWAVLLTEKMLERVTLVRFILASVVFAVQFLGGHPATSIHLLLVCAMAVIIRAFLPEREGEGDGVSSRRRSRWLRGSFALVTCILFGFALAALQWLPLIEYAQNSGAAIVRRETLQDERFIAFNPRYLIGVVFPYANGYPPDGITPFEIRQATGLPNTNELAGGWVGTIPLVLAGFAVATMRRREHRGTLLMWLIIAGIAAAIAVKFPIVDHIVRWIPALNVAQNARLLGVTALGLALLSGFGLAALVARLGQGEDVVRATKVFTWSAAAVAAVAVVLLTVLLIGRGTIIGRGIVKAKERYDADPVHEHSWRYVERLVHRVHTELTLTGVRLLIPAAMLGAGAGMLWLHKRHNRPRGSLAASPWPWLALAGIDLLWFGARYNAGAHEDTYFPTTPALAKLRELPPHRLAGTFRTLMPETSTAYGLSDVRGYDALGPRRYYKWWDHAGIADLPEYMRGYLSRFDKPGHRAWVLLNLGYLLTAPHHPAPPADLWQPVHTGDDANIYQATHVRPRAWVVPRAEVYDGVEAVLDRVAKMDFNPDEVVLLDRELVWDATRMPGAKQLSQSDFWGHGSRARLARQPTITFLESTTPDGDRPEIVRLQVRGALGGGWLVLADSYFPGWTASVVNDNGVGHEAAIVPAYGVLRAIQLPPESSSMRVEFRYRPWSWRIGAAVSAGAGAVLLVLIGLAMFGANNAARERAG